VPAISGRGGTQAVPTDWHVVGVGNFDNDANHTSDILWSNDNG